jgi:Mrp family chromosome partitioning ATPase
MSKIYEALRQHEYKTTPGDVPPRTQTDGDLLIANREMQALYRSIEAETSSIKGGKIIMFSSARAGEGKTTVCGSLAATLAQNFGRTVLILDGDRSQALSQRFGSSGGPSIASLEQSPEAVLQGAQRFGKRGSVAAVPVGSLVGSASADSPELSVIAGIQDQLRNTFDYILLDAPSVADVSWITSIGPLCDGVILVVEAESTRWPVLVNAKLEFESSGAKILGVFLNKRRFYIPPRVYRFL